MRRTAILLLAAMLPAACGASAPQASLTPFPGPTAGEAALRYACGEVPFDPAVLLQPGGAETGGDPLAAALREHLAARGPEAGMLPTAGWILVGATPVLAEFVAPDGAGGLAYVSVENAGGGWAVGGWGRCRPHAVLPGLSLASWVFDPSEGLPDPDATHFAALVTEIACTGSTEMGARLRPPTIVYGETEILVVFSAQPLPGGAHDCAGNPSTAVVVALREPLGERRLLDGSEYPPRDPSAPDQ